MNGKLNEILIGFVNDLKKKLMDEFFTYTCWRFEIINASIMNVLVHIYGNVWNGKMNDSFCK